MSCIEVTCALSQLEQVTVEGVVQGHTGSPGYERNVLLFQQASVMLATLTV